MASFAPAIYDKDLPALPAALSAPAPIYPPSQSRDLNRFLSTHISFLSEAQGVNAPHSTFNATSGDIIQHIYSSFNCLRCIRSTTTLKLWAFIFCFIAGLVLSILALLDPVIFIYTYPIGALMFLVGTGFLVSFRKQLKLMFKPGRVIALILFLASIVVVFAAVFTFHWVICVAFFILECLAYTWYTLSYVPCVCKVVRKMLGMKQEDPRVGEEVAVAPETV